MNLNNEAYGDIQLIRDIIEKELNNNKDCLFRIEIQNNMNDFNYDDLVKDNEIQGVLVTDLLEVSDANDGAEIKSISIRLLVPLDDNNMLYNSNITRCIKTLNNTQFIIDEKTNLTILFTDMQVTSSSKIDRPIKGNDYEEILINLVATTSLYFMQGDDDYIQIDGVTLKGKLSISEAMSKTCDGEVYGLNSPVQKNDINGVQHQITVDYLMYKTDPLHIRLAKEKASTTPFTIAYYDGYELNEYSMILASYETTSINGDSKKAKLIFLTS